MTQNIPCTVQVLTRNSGQTLRFCLESLADFDDVMVQDGGSSDDTRAIAKAFPNVRVLDQHPAHLGADSRISDYAAVRNDGLKSARHDWIFVADSDEIASPALVAEIRDIVARNNPGVYNAFRRFFIDGQPVMFCAGYPALQIRLFHRSCIDGFTKSIHEKLILKNGVQPRMLACELPTPLPPPAVLAPKYDRYLQMEVRRMGVMPFGRWFRWVFLRNIRSAIGLLLRAFQLRMIRQKGLRMPLAYECLYIRYQLNVIIRTFPLLARFRRSTLRSS